MPSRIVSEDTAYPDQPEQPEKPQPLAGRLTLLVKCPKCGGVEGYKFIVTQRQEWTGTWELPKKLYGMMQQPREEFVDGDDEIAKTIICLDCGKRISRKLMGT